MEQRLTIITIGVKNLQRSRDFYLNVFGWKPTENSTEGVVFFQLNGIQLALFPQESLADDAGVEPDGSGFRRYSLAHNMRSEQEVNQLVAQLEEKGARVVKRPDKVFWGGYSGYIADPDDNLWEIAYNPFLPLDDEGNTVSSSIH